MREMTLTYPPALYKLWRAGHVHRVWFWEHKGLFDELDLSQARHQYNSGHHFGEWFTAIWYWNKGYKVLIEKYAFKKHKEKFDKATKLLGRDGMALLRSRRDVQPPDLLVFDSDHRFFFAEVKRERDKMRKKQKEFFREIEKKLDCHVDIVNLSPAK